MNNIKTFLPAEALGIVNDAIFVDVREAHELMSGMIPEALHIPLGVLLSGESIIYELPRDANLVVYCQHGVRSLTGDKPLD